jgi:hypothetical protein
LKTLSRENSTVKQTHLIVSNRYWKVSIIAIKMELFIEI